jgi:2,4-dienoyl-CoA reductase-like NADH-dependent reductase (Old Yellow Enzyme family)
LIRAGDADLVAFGRAYIANPDLVARIASATPLAAPKSAGWYGGGESGYIDYPFGSSAGHGVRPGATEA